MDRGKHDGLAASLYRSRWFFEVDSPQRQCLVLQSKQSVQWLLSWSRQSPTKSLETRMSRSSQQQAVMAADQVIDAIVLQHAEEASFLFVQRFAAIRSASVTLRQLASHDVRIESHVDGLRVAAEAGWKVPEPVDGEFGTLFPTMILALEARDVSRIERHLSLAEAVPALQPALVGTFGWISASYLQGTAKDLLAATSPFRRCVAIASCVMHGVNPGQALSAAVKDSDPILRATALSAVGELGRIDLDSSCSDYLTDQDSACRFGAARSTVLLGNRGVALEALKRIGLEPGLTRSGAFRLMLQAMSVGASHGVLQQLGGDPQQIRWLIEGSGIAGDPKYVPWLIGHMANEKTARLAGEAFSLAIGVDLGAAGLEGEAPENFESGPNDNPDDPNVDMDPDDRLPWPDPKKIEAWWAANGGRFAPGTRYFMGAPVTREHCSEVLKNGFQRQRILAAHYLCLLDPGTPLFNTSAPAWRQQRLLAKMT
jgi:uncharacterized protein (TIGR02270 family)